MSKHKLLALILLTIFFIYAFFMFFYPIIVGGSFKALMNVWYEWQSFNVGMLAFLGGAFTYLSTTRRLFFERDLNRKVAIAKLPFALSELTLFLDNAIEYWMKSYSDVDQEQHQEFESVNMYEGKERDVICDCIALCEGAVSDDLVEVFNKLQVVVSRLHADNGFKKNKHNIISNMSCVVELSTRVSAFYDFSRGKSKYVKFDWKYSDLYWGTPLFIWDHQDQNDVKSEIYTLLKGEDDKT